MGRAGGKHRVPTPLWALLWGVLDFRGGPRDGVFRTRHPCLQLRLQGSLIPVASPWAPVGLTGQLLEESPMAQAAPHTLDIRAGGGGTQTSVSV